MIHPTANVYDSAKLGENVKVGAFAEIGHNVIIGNNCQIGCGAFIPENVIIEDNVFIAPHVCFVNDKYAPSKGKWRSNPPTLVRYGSTIGANATILPSIIIERRAMVGAGAVVTKHVEEGETVVGNPARPLK